MACVTFILGGARSGKSTRALELSQNHPRVFIATAEPLDDEMSERITLHQAERGPDWGVIEAPLEISNVINDHRSGTLLIDCLTLWLSNLMHHDYDVGAETTRLTEALRSAKADVVLVSNEVGLSIAPENALARRFRDAQGRLNQRVAAVADCVEFVAAGLPLRLKG
jgi:adenosylcobinamide kinase/adenosylcobinamide-phosphate guanylyltransferase